MLPAKQDFLNVFANFLLWQGRTRVNGWCIGR